MVETAALTAVAGVSQVEAGRAPGAGGVALVTRHSREQAGMEGRIGVTARAGSGDPRESRSSGMAFRAGQPGMSAG
jgi:hypothetical protein